MKEIANICEYKVGINSIIANFVCLSKCLLMRLTFAYRQKAILTLHVPNATLVDQR